LHSYIKAEQNLAYRGVATKYHSRYSAMFSISYANKPKAIEHVYTMLGLQSSSVANSDVRTKNTYDILEP
jgi:hypothetical protein